MTVEYYSLTTLNRMNVPTRKIARDIKAMIEMSAPSLWYTVLAMKVGENMSAAATTTSRVSRMPR